MDHVFVGQVERFGDHRLPRPGRRKRPASLFESGSGGAMDRTRDSAAGHELRVHGVHHGVHVRLLGDVAGDELEGQGADALLHRLGQGPWGCEGFVWPAPPTPLYYEFTVNRQND